MKLELDDKICWKYHYFDKYVLFRGIIYLTPCLLILIMVFITNIIYSITHNAFTFYDIIILLSLMLIIIVFLSIVFKFYNKYFFLIVFTKSSLYIERGLLGKIKKKISISELSQITINLSLPTQVNVKMTFLLSFLHREKPKYYTFKIEFFSPRTYKSYEQSAEENFRVLIKELSNKVKELEYLFPELIIVNDERIMEKL